MAAPPPPPPPPPLPPRLGPSQGAGPPPPSSSGNSVAAIATTLANLPLKDPLSPSQVSPWYARWAPFPPDSLDQVLEGPPKHSGVAPMHPSLHPRFYSDLPDQSKLRNAGYFKDGTEADLFYLSLYNQWRRFRRSTHWQYGVMNRHVKFSDRFGLISGGHRQLTSGPVLVNQATNPNFLPGHVAQISGSNDLATYDQVFEKIYELERIQVDETKWFPFFHKDRWYDCIQPSADGRYWSIDDSEIWEVLKVPLELANRIFSSLIEDQHDFMHTLMYGLLGPWETVVDHFWTDPKPQAPYSGATVLVSYDVLKQHCLLNGLDCPLDVIIGLGRDEWRSRLEDLLRDLTWTFVPDTPSEGIHHRDPFAMSTIGIGTDSLRPLLNKKCEVPLPSNLRERRRDQENMSAASTSSSYPFYYAARAMVPATWASKMLSASFWEDRNIPAKSDHFFHRSLIFRSETIWNPIYRIGRDAFWSPPSVRQLRPGETLTDDDRRMIQTWTETEKIFAQAHGNWVAQGFTDWTNTPWGNFTRIDLQRFRIDFSDKNSVTCHGWAEILASHCTWDVNTANYTATLPPFATNLTNWIWHAIGYLAFAAIPIQLRRETYVKKGKMGTWEAVPSSSMTGRIGKKLMDDEDDITTKSQANLWIDSFSGTRILDANQITQIMYLDLIHGLMYYLASQNVIASEPWVMEILRVEGILRNKRTQMAAASANSKFEFVDSWDFNIPAYSHKQVQMSLQYSPALNRYYPQYTTIN
ncbi:hypothetical protein GGR57DRAFT_515757 [Xylariaceae sp. FL1272]|nr:hypothetical protein GGR57DRAFT_515757 [Xylariaceae sp. FL1272]